MRRSSGPSSGSADFGTHPPGDTFRLADGFLVDELVAFEAGPGGVAGLRALGVDFRRE